MVFRLVAIRPGRGGPRERWCHYLELAISELATAPTEWCRRSQGELHWFLFVVVVGVCCYCRRFFPAFELQYITLIVYSAPPLSAPHK